MHSKRIVASLVFTALMSLPATAADEYMWDDGFAELNIPANAAAHLVWLNHFDRIEGFETITDISVVWGDVDFNDKENPATLWIYDDPNGDGQPDDAEPIMSMDVLITASDGETTFTKYDIPDTAVGSSFFIAVSGTFGGGEGIMALDTNMLLQRSWIGLAFPGDFDGAVASLNILPLTTTAKIFAPGGTWMVRANAVAGGGDGIEGDIDGDGIVGTGDLLILLGSWGPCGDCRNCDADFDDDCTVGTTDLLIMLGNWG